MTDTAKGVAQTISFILNCEIEEVTDTKKCNGFIGFLKSGREVGQKKTHKDNGAKTRSCTL